MCLSEGVRKNILCVSEVCDVVWEQVQAAGLFIGCCQVILWLGLVILIKAEAVIGKDSATTHNSLERSYMVIFVVWIIFLFLPLLRRFYKVVLFCLDPL